MLNFFVSALCWLLWVISNGFVLTFVRVLFDFSPSFVLDFVDCFVFVHLNDRKTRLRILHRLAEKKIAKISAGPFSLSPPRSRRLGRRQE